MGKEGIKMKKKKKSKEKLHMDGSLLFPEDDLILLACTSWLISA